MFGKDDAFLTPRLQKSRSTQAGSLDESLQTITKLESVAEGGSGATPSKDQNEGREKLQVGGGWCRGHYCKS